MSISIGTCLHLSTDGQKHLWVVLTEPDEGDPPKVAMVNIATYTGRNPDDTLLLDDGHPFIKRRSAVHYERARIYEVWKLEKMVEADLTVKHREDCSLELLEKLRDGLMKSRFTPIKVKNFCRDKFN